MLSEPSNVVQERGVGNNNDDNNNPNLFEGARRGRASADWVPASML